MSISSYIRLARNLGFLASISLSYGSASAQSSETSLDTTLLSTVTLEQTVLQSLPIQTDTLNEEDLSSFASNSVSESLSYAPGLFIENSSGRIKSPSIRGSSSSHTLILVDGRRTSPGFKSMTDLNQYLLGGVAQVEILRGPASALYGSDAIGGVVNILTQHGISKSPSSRAYFEYGTGEWDSLSAGVSSETLQGPWGIAASISSRTTDQWESGDGAPSDVDDLETYNTSVNLDYHLSEDQTLRTHFDYALTERTGMRPTSGGAERHAEDERVGFSAEYENNFSNDDSQLVIRTYTNTYSGDITFDLPAQKAAAFNLATESQILVGEARYSQRFSDSLNSFFGFEYRNTEYEIESESSTNQSVDNLATYSQFVWDPNASTEAILGLRYDNQDGYGSRLSPSAAISWNSLTSGWQLHAGLGNGFRAPNVTELLIETYANGGKTTIQPNAELKPETSTNIEAGLSYIASDWTFEATAFRNEVSDMIEQVTLSKQGKLTTAQWQNLSEVEIEGVELIASYKLDETFRIEASYTRVDPIDQQTGYHVEGQHESNARLKFYKDFSHWGIRANLALNWAGKIWGATDTIAYESAFTVDTRISKSLNEHFELFAGAKNLLDAEESSLLPAHYFTGANLRF
ncbi:TonB-dependent receptor plug domain-containing protein [Pelagicoccus albus]|uniref:TonB-dependent receptor n=1 Tax=Pelagicoccus albus TaxID=415222 RepID=A0A7X1B962_9BACT|nr:TonB-dependent receptor [Pelagicoccus albus]MBC2607847.1 TonB-dependent receptor [Pelagicoccus albus]